MWSEFQVRIEENERDRTVPLRGALFDVIRGSGLRPGQGVIKKMVAFEFGQGERLLWEIQDPARNVFLHRTWQHRLEQAGFACELRPYQKGEKDGGRHSALSREWSFGDEDCIVLRIDIAHDLRRLLDLLLPPGAELTERSFPWCHEQHHFRHLRCRPEGPFHTITLDDIWWRRGAVFERESAAWRGICGFRPSSLQVWSLRA